MRFLKLKYIVPYVQAGATFLGFIEARSDDQQNNCQLFPGACGISTGTSLRAGAAFFD
jgi:hypothetical protein